ncbi:ArsR/SmtB family transcription factor [Nocardia sp. alder85J]|uniref:ArsR/SmtB family transcription factor n=1 Tax=Nocardia sp. alder85J TaxID=2862949 RepID=UPI001CD52780|nr:metalloregulator ArsR/SmtB family transcription factor [Nocardia sp. alder85J]MCX4091404.1 metalloregulator ArsR/SmtB family transcription factor [Nocardia sp. alder85J]
MERPLARIFDALADPVRHLILELVRAGEQPAGAIVTAVQAITPISQPAVSQHLKVLREAGLLSVRVEGTRRIYALDPTGTRAAQEWLAWLRDPLAPFAQPLDALATEVTRGKRERRAAGDRDARSA